MSEVRMKTISDIDTDSLKEVEEQIAVRKKVYDTLLGNLYKGIVYDEICTLSTYLNNLTKMNKL